MSKLTSPWQVVWCTSTTGLFFPLFDVLTTDDVGAFQASWELAAPSTTIQARPAFRLSYDGRTWVASTNYPAAFSSSTGWNHGTTWAASTDGAGGARPFMQPGVIVKRDTGSGLAYARVRMALLTRISP